jgi:hypothetical protein
MTQLFSNELQRLSQRTEGAFAANDHAMPPLLGALTPDSSISIRAIPSSAPRRANIRRRGRGTMPG